MRIFDVEEAKRFVPSLAAVFTEIRTWIPRIQENTRELQTLGEPAEIRSPIGDPASRGGKLRAERNQLIARIQDEVAKLEACGIEVRSLDGLVDFRALRSGRQVYLCWQYGDPTVRYWHELDHGFGGRQPIEDTSAFAPSFPS
jgi:hypothetical protein